MDQKLVSAIEMHSRSQEEALVDQSLEAQVVTPVRDTKIVVVGIVSLIRILLSIILATNFCLLSCICVFWVVAPWASDGSVLGAAFSLLRYSGLWLVQPTS